MKISIIFVSTISTLLVSCTSSTKLANLLKRHKRWDTNGGMNNNGDMSGMFRGTAGVDYPDFKAIPTTSFRCDDQIYEGGLYADVEAQCQVYHVCHDGRKDSFLCGRGTIFNQEILACDYWYSTECDKAPSFYYVNQQIGNSGSSWVPPSGGYQQDNPSNFQDVNNRQNYPNNDGSNTGFGSNNNNGQTSGFNPNNNSAGQGGGYGSNNGQSGGFNPNYNTAGQSGGFGSNNDGQGGGFASNDNSRGGSNNNGQNSNNKEDCCCQKFSYKTPWQFPAS